MKTAEEWAYSLQYGPIIRSDSVASAHQCNLHLIKQIQLDAAQHGLRLAVEAKPEGVFPPMSTKDVAINNALREYVANILAIDPAKGEGEGTR